MNGDLIASLRKKIDEVLQPLIPTGTECALLDFPNHSNFGDSAIWLGEKAWLKRNGADVVYTCELKFFDFRKLTKRLERGGTVLLSGGGNFGDLYPAIQRLRESIISSLHDYRIIQLPQTVYFQDNANAMRTKAVLEEHPQFILLVRERQSLETAQRLFRIPIHLCPDMAFALGALKTPGKPKEEIFWLVRKDKESASFAGSLAPSVPQMDWADAVLPKGFYVKAFLYRQWLEHPRKLRFLKEMLPRSYDTVARQRFDAALKMLGLGKVVITDRLHGHILCLLSGIPHVILDNTYNKVRGFYDMWTRACGSVRWAESPKEALALARFMAASVSEA